MVIYQDRLGANTGKTPKLTCSQTLKSNYGAGFLVTTRLGGGLSTATTGGFDADSAFNRVSEVLGTLSEGIKEEPSSTMVKRFEVPR
jgi:hypothetical protein